MVSNQDSMEIEMNGQDPNIRDDYNSEQQPQDFKIIFDCETANVPVVSSQENYTKYAQFSPRSPAPYNAVPQTRSVFYHIDAIPDSSVFDFNIASCINKPWTNPQANLSDYFNYGFDEYKWWRFSDYIVEHNNGYGAIVKNINGRQYGIPANLLTAGRQYGIFATFINLIKPKPWLLPGADSSHFFNYDLNEKTWKPYCGVVFNKLVAKFFERSGRT